MGIKAFVYHKRAERYCDCQDCFGINTQNNRIAISDGMSQSIFPQWWARILVDAYLKNGTIPQDNIIPYQNIWQEKVRAEIVRQESEGKNPWLLRDMFAERSGAGATLCGFEWDKNGWRCQCLGDSCLIKIKNDYSIEIITSQNGKFDNHPDYLDSFSDGRGTPVTEKGDFNLKAILIVSDPFAELFQIHQEEPTFICERLNEINNLTDHESYATLVDHWRDQYNLHNDDSTLVILYNLLSKEVKIVWEDSLDNLCKKEQLISPNDKSLPIEIDYNQREMEVAEAQFINSTENLLKFYPTNCKRSKGKILEWLKGKYISVVNSYTKK